MWASFKLIIKATPPDGLTHSKDSPRAVQRGSGERGDVQSQAYPMDKAAPCLPNCASFIYNNYNCKKFEQSSCPKAAQLTDSQGRGRKEGRGGEGVEKLANSNMQANSAHFLRGARESPANWNYYLLDNQCKAQEAGGGRRRR